MCILYFEKCALLLISEYLLIFNPCPYDTRNQRPNHPNKNIPFFYHTFNKSHWNPHLVYNWYLNSLSLFFPKKEKEKEKKKHIRYVLTVKEINVWLIITKMVVISIYNLVL